MLRLFVHTCFQKICSVSALALRFWRMGRRCSVSIERERGHGDTQCGGGWLICLSNWSNYRRLLLTTGVSCVRRQRVSSKQCCCFEKLTPSLIYCLLRDNYSANHINNPTASTCKFKPMFFAGCAASHGGSVIRVQWTHAPSGTLM